jgi:zinc-binding in reverse transcriptase
MSKDSILWRWSLKGVFTVHSLYEWLQYEEIFNLDFISICNTKLPLKIQIFLWLVKINRVLTKVNLQKRG